MSTTLADFIQDNSSGLFIPPQARRQVIPYDDLQALATPTQLSQISPDLLSALAILTAQGPDRPRLLTADANGSLVTAAQINTVTTFIAPFTGGGLTAQIKDVTGFAPGMKVTMTSANFGGAVCSAVTVTSVKPPHTINFFATCTGQDFVVGDFIVGHGRVDVESILLPVSIGGQSVLTAVGFVGTPDNQVMMTTTIRGHRRFAVDDIRSIDGNASVQQVQPAAATINIPAFGAGFRAVVDWFEFSLLNNSGAATGPVAQVWDGAVGTGTLKWNSTMLAPAAQSIVTVFRNDMRIKGSDNTPMNLAYSLGGANVFESISVGYYVEG